MLREIFDVDRRLRVNYKKLLSLLGTKEDLVSIVDRYLFDYAVYNQLTVDDIVQSYQVFVSRYSDDIKNFMATQKYPVEMGKSAEFHRLDYDIALILSVVTSIHRYKIIDNIRNVAAGVGGRVAVVGAGSGLELELMNLYSPAGEIESFDLNVSGFVKKRFNAIRVFERKFLGVERQYDNIFAVELLEHLADPYQFLSVCCSSLRNDGRLFTTTAMNVPQCDHLYNFLDDRVFENKVYEIGFKVEIKDEIPHDSINKNLNAKNTWYVLQKNK